MRNENLLSFLLIKRRILKLLAIKYAYSLIVLCGISFMACSDDDPVKKNPYLQTSTRAMLKEVVEVVFNNIDSNTDITVDFGDGTAGYLSAIVFKRLFHRLFPNNSECERHLFESLFKENRASKQLQILLQ